VLTAGTLELHALRDRLRQRLAILLPQVSRRLRDAGDRYKRYADRRAVPYNPDNLVGKRVAVRRDVRLKIGTTRARRLTRRSGWKSHSHYSYCQGLRQGIEGPHLAGPRWRSARPRPP
jgi:hypothetical protein